jgi:predicted ATPase
MTAMGWVRSTDFVGRWTEQPELADFPQRVAAHDGGAVLLAGEPGIGKSRLAEDTADNATRAGFTVAWGRCRESEGAPPLWPWIQVLRQLHINSVPPSGDSDPAARFRFFDQVTALLNELCRRLPLLIVLDDVHRADEMSLRLLAFVTDQIWPAPLGLVVAYRNEESTDGLWTTVIPGISAY